MNRRRIGLVAVEVGVPAILLLVWQIASSRTESFYFPPLLEILALFASTWTGDALIVHAVPSLSRMLQGLMIGSFLGVAIGAAVGMSATIRALMHPVLEFLRALPPIVLIPFGIVVFGIDDSMKIFIIAIGVLFPVLLNTVDGVSGVDSILLDVSKSFGFSLRERLFQVVLPAATPQIFAGVRVGMAVAFILMIVSEMVASSEGIGYFILHAQRFFRVAEMWTGIVLLGILGYLLNGILLFFERKLLAWHRGSKASALSL